MDAISRRVVGALSSSLSWGPGYEPQPLGTQVADDRVAGYYLDLRRKANSQLRPRVNGRGEILPPGPTAIAQRVLGFHEELLAGRDAALEPMLRAVEVLRARSERVGDALLWRYDTPVPKYARTPPWYSCMAQGQAASALVRVYQVTGDESHAQAAVAALRAFDLAPLGLVHQLPEGPVLEECPSDPPSHILNGWIFGLWGLLDVALGLDSPVARSLFDDSAGTLRRLVGRYDASGWSRYSLYPPQSPDLAKPFYHRIHVDQLEAMYRITGWDQFGGLAQAWRAGDRPARRARVLASKANAVLLTPRP